jgi:hypothetical protein
MSGNAGIRGYYYQVLAGLLDSVEDDSWESIKIEPSTKDDKVDIEWVFADSIRAVQVKSSINNFERSMLINWIYTLVKDARSAYEMFGLPMTYKLYLIGTTDRKADKWISDLNGGRLKIEEDSKLKEIESELSNVEVKKKNFDFEDLNARAYISMQEYLDRNGKGANLENIKTLCSVIVSELLKFTMQGRPMTKALFLKLVNKHVENGEYGITNIQKAVPELSLVFYENGKVLESDKMVGIRLENSPLVNKFLTHARNGLNKAKAIMLPMPVPKEADAVKRDTPITDSSIVDTETVKTVQEISKSMKGIKEVFDSGKNISEWIKVNSLSNIISGDGYIQERMPVEEIVELKELSKSILSIELTDEDFFFGGLKKRAFPSQRMFGGPVNIPRGTDEEKAKYFAIQDAYTSLLSYKSILEYTDYLRKCHPLPIVLKNTGNAADEEIQVTIKFPKNTRIVTPLRMEAPFEPFIEDFITNNNVFDALITPARDHTVMEYEGRGYRMQFLPKRLMPFESVHYTPKDFADHLACLFDYEHFQDDNTDIVQYEFKALNPSCKMAFPTFLLVQSNADMDIEYTITSKYLSKPIEGTMHWLHPDKTAKTNSC